MSAARVGTGLDVLSAERFARLRGRRVGLIANPTSVDARLRHLVDLIADAPGVALAALFGPEHGIRAEAQDLIGVSSGVDRRTGVPIHSLYGADVASLAPSPDQLEGLDVLVFDVQDVGSRYYTFPATMKYAMTAAAKAGVSFVVLDRPNPIGGERIEGPTVEPGFESFIGSRPIPIRHGMTIGELAQLDRAELGLDLDLTVIPCDGLSRSMLWAETGLPWVLPSPNMPTPDTALVYPGGCLIEGTNLSEGRGTTRPFELWGSPWLDPYALADEIGRELDACDRGRGIILRPCTFRPTFQKHAGADCGGVQVHVTDPSAFRPAAVYSIALAVARRLGLEQPLPEHGIRGDQWGGAPCPPGSTLAGTEARPTGATARDKQEGAIQGGFAWRTETYEFVSEPIAIDLLFGSSRERSLIESGPPSEWASDLFDGAWRREEAAFAERREPYLLYR